MQFPDSLEPCRSGYSRNLLGEPYQGEFDSFVRRRRQVRRRGVHDTLCWVCDSDQYLALTEFHRQAGGQYFTIELPDWQGFSVTTARFDSPLTVQQVGERYEVTASLYLPTPTVMPPEDLDYWLLWLIGITDGTFNDPLHDFVHNQWPGYWGAEP